jgi:hypothetical protein
MPKAKAEKPDRAICQQTRTVRFHAKCLKTDRSLPIASDLGPPDCVFQREPAIVRNEGCPAVLSGGAQGASSQPVHVPTDRPLDGGWRDSHIIPRYGAAALLSPLQRAATG